MRPILIVAVAVYLIGYSGAYQPGPVPSSCLNCICNLESNCITPSPLCHPDPVRESCGLYQIQQPYFTDAQPYANIGNDFQSCAGGRACSEKAVQGYMTRYATQGRLGHAPTCQDFARIHNGGPNGYSNSNTLGYWNRMKTCLGI